MEALAFWIAVLIYIGLLCWCMKPVVCGRSTIIGTTARLLLVGFMLLHNVTPIFAIITLRPLMISNEPVAERVMSVILFAHSIPAYFRGLEDARNRYSTAVSMTYSMKIGTNELERTVSVKCSSRDFLHAEKGLATRHRRRFPTTSGGQMQIAIGKYVLAFNHANEICSLLRRGILSPGSLPAPSKQLLLFLIREPADIRQVYALSFPNSGGLTQFEDIELNTPQVLKIKHEPRDLAELIVGGWPKFEFRWRGHPRTHPPVVQKLLNLAPDAKRCVSFIDIDAYFSEWKDGKVWRPVGYPRKYKPVETDASCGFTLDGISLTE